MALQPDLHANQSILVYIDSEDAEADYQSGDLAGVSADFILDLEEPIICPENQMMLASMYSCSIPYSFYDIRNDVNDKIQFKIFNSGTGLSATFDIDFGANLPNAPYYGIENSHGNYSTTSLSTQVNLIFTELIRPGLIAGGYANVNSEIQLFFIPTKGKYMVRLLNFPAGLVPQIQQQGEGYMDTEIGLPQDDTAIRVFAVDGIGTYFLLCPNVVDITGSTHGLFLRTNLASDSTIASDTGRSTDILAHIPITGNQGDIIHSPPQSNLHKSRVKVKAINHIHIQLRDERNRPMDFNGLHTHIVILIDFVYERKKIIPDNAFRRQKEIFQHRIQGQLGELAGQGFKGPLTYSSRSRRVPAHEPDLVAQPHAPNVEVREIEKEQVEQAEKEEEKMEETENIEVEQSGLDSNEVDTSQLVKDTI